MAQLRSQDRRKRFAADQEFAKLPEGFSRTGSANEVCCKRRRALQVRDAVLKDVIGNGWLFAAEITSCLAGDPKTSLAPLNGERKTPSKACSMTFRSGLARAPSK
jgi:hypothetical protein